MTNRDVKGIERGACTKDDCQCAQFAVPSVGVKCSSCDHPPGLHVNLSVQQPVSSSFSSSSLRYSVAVDGDDEDESVRDKGRLPTEEPNDSSRSTAMTQLTAQLLQSVDFFALSHFQTQGLHRPVQRVPRATTASIQQMPMCKLPGCDKPVHYDQAARSYYDYCGKTHATEHRSQLLLFPSAADLLPPHLKCKTSGCERQRCPNPNGGFYDYCSATCRNSVEPGLPPDQICSLKGCRNRKFTDPNGNMMDYCCQGHASEALRRGERHANINLLDANSARHVIAKFQTTWVKGQCPPVDHVFEIASGNLKTKWDSFKDTLAKKGSPTNVEEHFHGTTVKCDLAGSRSVCRHKDCGVCGISRQGFQKVCIRKNIAFQRFGHGFYLAPNSSKCHDYTQGSHTHRAMLLCDVLPGKKHVVTNDQTDLTAPPHGHDSVYGKTGGILNYPEIVLYEEDAILPRYVILYQKNGTGKIAS